MPSAAADLGRTFAALATPPGAALSSSCARSPGAQARLAAAFGMSAAA